MKKVTATVTKKKHNLQASYLLIEKAERISGLDLSFLDNLTDEPLKDEVVRLPYEDTQTTTRYYMD